MRRNTTIIVGILLVSLLVGTVAGYETILATNVGFITGTRVNSGGDTFGAACYHILGDGGFGLHIAYDFVGIPVNGETINAVGILRCNSDTQVVYLENFSVGPGGWIAPVFPSHAVPQGDLNFTVGYLGRTYEFSAAIPPIGSSCVTLHVPSGAVTRVNTDTSC